MSEERKNHRLGRCLRAEPEGLDVLMRNGEVEHAFKQVGHWRFCEKLQGGHIFIDVFHTCSYVLTDILNS